MKFSTCAVAALVLAAQVGAGFLDITDGYNVLTFGNFYDVYDQIYGKIAVGEMLLSKTVLVSMLMLRKKTS